ncbi:nitroreductase family protein [Porphyromonas cangingivalis]|uniref:nitroreductase family protein n=1 Tax=Porphyromonas cangingivalis TaxID=36874 RepID=UPI0021AC8A2A|nr:nitroreductase family protein [Porphyromonas cangingivalis]
MTTKIEMLKDALAHRHSHYGLRPEWVAPRETVEDLIGHVLQTVPSAFNSQPVRMVLLTGDAHTAHWKLVEDALISIMGQEAYEANTAAKIRQAFASGIGTVLFFDVPSVTEGLQASFPAYAANFPLWAQQVQGSHQHAVWMGLDMLGFGASLQHYIGMVDSDIKALAGVDASWVLSAQMPFGAPLAEAEGKEKLPLSETFIVK